MNKALATRNYDARFSLERRPSRDHAHCPPRAGGSRNRTAAVAGWLRRNSCAPTTSDLLLARSATVLVEQRQNKGPFGSLPQFDASVSDSTASKRCRRPISRSPARVIAVNPKDQFRFGYRLWLDEKTAMPLKRNCAIHAVRSSNRYSLRAWTCRKHPDGDLAPPCAPRNALGAPRPSPDSTSAALGAYRASQLPPGFRLTVQVRKPGRRLGAGESFGLFRWTGDRVRFVEEQSAAAPGTAVSPTLHLNLPCKDWPASARVAFSTSCRATK